MNTRKRKNLMLYSTITIIIIIILFTLIGKTHALTLDNKALEFLSKDKVSDYLNKHEIPEYLHKYVSGIKMDIRDNIYVSNGITYQKLAETSYYGVITVFSKNLTSYQLLHEFGHILHWRMRNLDRWRNTETMAWFFAYEAQRTNSLEELLDRWNMWRKIFRVMNIKYN